MTSTNRPEITNEDFKEDLNLDTSNELQVELDKYIDKNLGNSALVKKRHEDLEFKSKNAGFNRSVFKCSKGVEFEAPG